MSKQIKVIVSDMDGTLLNEDKELTQATLEILIKAQQLGVRLVLASGRNVSMLKPYAEQLRMFEYGGFLIGNNGQQCFDCSDSQMIEDGTIDVKLAQSLFTFAKANHLICLLESKQGFMIHTPWVLFPIKAIVLYLKTRHKLKKRQQQPYAILSGFTMDANSQMVTLKNSNQINHPVTKVGIAQYNIWLKRREKKLIELFKSEVAITKVTSFWYDIMPSHINKGLGVKWVSEKTKIGLDQFVAFGDAQNDISMFEVVATSYAMANAMADVKAKASEICKRNDENGVAKKINDLLQLGYDV